MNKNKYKAARRQRRKYNIRKGLEGTPQRPRLTVFRSLNHCYAQVVNDYEGKTLAAASTRDKDLGLSATGNSAAAAAVGKQIAAKAKQAGVETVVFDRNGFPYHGRIKALADAAREAGLKF